jgi:hypothetical protein
MDTLVKEWRLAKEQGISVPGKDYGGENND